jgi:LacI family transcriptional regulator
MRRSTRRSKSAVTLRAVAAHAGVSVMSVSNVLNGRLASAEMKEKVERAFRELNYVPNQAARQLASAGPMFVGLLHHSDEHPVAAAIMNGALRAASRLNVQLLLEPIVYADLEWMGDALERLRDRGAEGCIVAPGYGEVLDAQIAANGPVFPLFYVGAGAALPNLYTVRIDDEAAACEMTSLLISKGHSRIGFIPVPEKFSIHCTRLAGYKAALRKHGMPFDPALVIEGEYTLEDGMAAAASLLNLADPPTAIFASNDEMAAGTLVVAHTRGLEVPRDLVVAGFDDTYIAQTVWPPLTSVKVPFAAMAEQAVESIVNLIRAGRDAQSVPITSTVLAHTIVRRGSTGD